MVSIEIFVADDTPDHSGEPTLPRGAAHNRQVPEGIPIIAL